MVSHSLLTIKCIHQNSYCTLSDLCNLYSLSIHMSYIWYSRSVSWILHINSTNKNRNVMNLVQNLEDSVFFLWLFGLVIKPYCIQGMDAALLNDISREEGQIYHAQTRASRDTLCKIILKKFEINKLYEGFLNAGCHLSWGIWSDE